jgi:spore maturation protein CgeB
MDRFNKFARSKQGKDLTEKAQRYASDPKNRRKLEEMGKKYLSRGKKSP